MSKEVAWWDQKAQQVQDKADQGDAFGVFATFKELRLRGASISLGEVRPADAPFERDAWAEHFRLIGEGPGSVEDRVWANVPSFSPMDAVWGNAPAPNELHAALRQMSLGKAAGEDEVTAELLKFGGDNLWEAVVRVCREQWMLLTEAGSRDGGGLAGGMVRRISCSPVETQGEQEGQEHLAWDYSFIGGL